ncbi:NAD-dependent protein deacetylase sirtuin-2 [Entomortierella beljakovae]|nr:NAD-dependent protein deacetylase sirtuin-2 [Entomortierella beljakovae]
MSSAASPRIPLKSRPLKPKPEPEPRIQILKDETVNAIAHLINSGEAKNIIVMTGAGISTAAGIKDFRSPGTGLYDDLEKYNLPFPEAVFDLEFFKNTPSPFYHLAKHLYPGQYKPTLTHYFLSLLAKKKLLLRSYTQNIDSLERLAGLDEDLLVEAHGSFAYSKCVQCETTSDPDWVKSHIMNDEIPYCKRCSGLVKPSITFFGENVPLRFTTMADTDFEKCDLLIVLGTSLKVEPFNKLISKVSPRCPRVLINREKAGQDLHSGFDFDDKWKYTIQRDALFLGNCDDGIRELSTLCGWESELQFMYDTGHKKLTLKMETESLIPKLEREDDDDDDDDNDEKDDQDHDDEQDRRLEEQSSDSADSLDDITHRLEQSVFFTRKIESNTSSKLESQSEVEVTSKVGLEQKSQSLSTSLDVSSTKENSLSAIHPVPQESKKIEITKDKAKEKTEKLDVKSDKEKSEITPKDNSQIVDIAGKVDDEPSNLHHTSTCAESQQNIVSTVEVVEARFEKSDTTHDNTIETEESKNECEPSPSLRSNPKEAFVYSATGPLTDVDVDSTNTLVTSLASASGQSSLTIATAVSSSQQLFSTCIPVTSVLGSIGVESIGNADGNRVSGIYAAARSDGIGSLQMARSKRRKEFENVSIVVAIKSGIRHQREHGIFGPNVVACGRVAKRRRVV